MQEMWVQTELRGVKAELNDQLNYVTNKKETSMIVSMFFILESVWTI